VYTFLNLLGMPPFYPRRFVLFSSSVGAAGGKREGEDSSAAHTAWREFWEESGQLLSVRSRRPNTSLAHLADVSFSAGRSEAVPGAFSGWRRTEASPVVLPYVCSRIAAPQERLTLIPSFFFLCQMANTLCSFTTCPTPHPVPTWPLPCASAMANTWTPRRMDDQDRGHVQADGDEGEGQRDGLPALGPPAGPARRGPRTAGLRRRRHALPGVPLQRRHHTPPRALSGQRRQGQAAHRASAPVGLPGAPIAQPKRLGIAARRWAVLCTGVPHRTRSAQKAAPSRQAAAGQGAIACCHHHCQSTIHALVGSCASVLPARPPSAAAARSGIRNVFVRRRFPISSIFSLFPKFFCVGTERKGTVSGSASFAEEGLERLGQLLGHAVDHKGVVHPGEKGE
jgi:hypothetical protein